ncbi:MAG TPA: circadian clock KaiB family protein [Opitutaceae bacterium]|nr:circadian clock KaiB family protein [Opitutaceae bacterium]
MKAKRSIRLTKAFANAVTAARSPKYVLRLYVAGASERSRKAVLRARELCEAQLKDNYELEVIDVYQQPILARDGQILATPTLVRELPRPMRWLIGNLANTTGLFVGLDMATKQKAAN